MRLLFATRKSLYNLSYRHITQRNSTPRLTTSTLRLYTTRYSANMSDAVAKESEVIPISAEQANPATTDAAAPSAASTATGEDGAPAEQSKKGGEQFRRHFVSGRADV